MEELIKELISEVAKLNSFSVGDAISFISLLGAWITIAILIKEKIDNARPYLQISFELIRENLVCIVLRNVGNTPLEIKRIRFNSEFINQLPEREKEGLINTDNINSIKIFPAKEWIICLGVTTSEIINNYNIKQLQIDYEYSRIGRKKVYKEFTNIDFTQYSRMLVYISEIDELKKQNKKIEKELKSINKEVKNIETIIANYINLSDEYYKTIVTGYKNE